MVAARAVSVSVFAIQALVDPTVKIVRRTNVRKVKE